MTEQKMPELPEPTFLWDRPEYPHYTPSQMRARDLQVWKAAMEYAAKVCIEQGRKSPDTDGMSFYIATGQCAAALRSLPPPEQGGGR